MHIGLDIATMPDHTSVMIRVPVDRLNQVGSAMRAAANQFHGAVARSPDDKFASAWRASAGFFDETADMLFAAAGHTTLER